MICCGLDEVRRLLDRRRLRNDDDDDEYLYYLFVLPTPPILHQSFRPGPADSAGSSELRAPGGAIRAVLI